MKRKTSILIGSLLLIACCLLTACGSGSNTGKLAIEAEEAGGYQNDYATDDVYDMEMAEAYGEDSGSGEGNILDEDRTEQSVASDRKLIKTVDMTVETEEFDVLTQKLADKVEALGGYMEKAYVSGTSINASYESTRSASYTARIPADKLKDFITEVSSISNVLDKNESVEDITLNYVDLESKKNTLKIEQERITALLEQADSIETIVTLESRLTEIRYQLESMESQLRTYDNLVDYATIYLNVEEVERITPVAPQSAFEKMKDGFANSVYRIGRGIKNFVIGFVIVFPYLFIWGILILIFICIVKGIIKSRQKKAEKREEALKASYAQENSRQDRKDFDKK
ncbi:MAG: DUF4349 domain-containing protein [Lachnospiraceae bacterium]|nr:DUF4349 domain-containing protein [Lachnospiraceae bacterium]